VTLNDTVTLSQAGELQNFRLGFPFKYKSNLYYVFAYESQNPQQRLTLELDVGLGTPGFYGIRVNFGRQLNLDQQGPYSFTVIFEFSGLITPNLQKVEMFDLDFPVYPSLDQVSISNTTVVLPSNANYTSSSHNFTQASSNTFNIAKNQLPEYTSETGIISFQPIGFFNLLENKEVRRNIILDEWNELIVSDFYSTTNKAANETFNVLALLPQKAYAIDAKDNLRNKLTITQQSQGEVIKATINLRTSIKQNLTAQFLVSFKLPWKDYISQNEWNGFALNFKLFEPMNLTLRKLVVTIDLPEGAEFQSSNAAIDPDIVQRGAYEKMLIFTLNNISSYKNYDFTINYKHVLFWSSFRPTLWTGALVTIIGAIALLWQIRKAPAPILVPTTLLVRPEELRNYVRTYEEKRKIQRERESLEVQARKGKVPRRLFRVRSRTLESRLSVLSRDLSMLREKIRAAGARYTDMMRQIEVAETELQGVEADLLRTEARYRRGEISAAAYHKLLEDSYKRKDRAKTSIDGVLLRLKEEII